MYEVRPFSVTRKKNRSATMAPLMAGAHLLLRHMQLKAAKVLVRRRIWRPAEEGREASYIPDVVLLGLLIEMARVMSSIMRWRNGLMGLSSIAKAPVSHGVRTP